MVHLPLFACPAASAGFPTAPSQVRTVPALSKTSRISRSATARHFLNSTWNVRIGLQFTEYLHLYGGTTNFDGSYFGGTHNAQGNNSVFAYAWFAF
jgi:hypothetical protein